MNKKLVASFLAVVLILPMVSWIPLVSAEPEDPTWEMYRPQLPPHDSLHINETVHNANTNDEASVGIGIQLYDYVENWSWDPYNERDGVCFRVAVTTNTRKGITYTCLGPGFYLPDEWIEATDPVPGVTGDDSGSSLDLPFPVQFYGGPGYDCKSAQYSEVWVCSNGFLSFDSNSTSSNPNPGEFPDPEEPNSLIAVYWADLLIDEQAEVTYYADYDYFCVCWKNVLNENNGQRQTFEVIIENTILFPRGQNPIKLLYKSVDWNNSGARVSIEDQEGYKGTMGSHASSGEKLEFKSLERSAEIRRLKIEIEKSDPDALVFTDSDPYSLKGINVMLEDDTPDTDLWYCEPLKDWSTLLISAFLAAACGTAAGIIFEATLIGIETVAVLAHEFSPLKFEEVDVKNDDTGYKDAHIYAKAEGDHGYPVDASLGAQMHWVFTDDNDQDHSVTVTAELEYYSYQTYEIETISTSVDLTMKIGRTLTIFTSSGGTTNPEPGTHTYDYGDSINVNASAYSGYDFDYWILDGGKKYANPITVTMNFDHNLKAYFEYTGGGPGTCPFVHPWNGTAYAIDNNLLGDSEASGGADVDDYYRLEQPLVCKEGKYSLLIKEFEHEHSYLDQVELMAVDHESDVHVAVSPNGEILTYKIPYTPISAIDNHGNSQLDLVVTVDDDYYEGQPDDHLLLDFGSLDTSNGAKLVFRANFQFKDKTECIHVQILDAAEGWVDVVAVRTRVHWSTQIVDLSGYLPDADGQLRVRLYFTANHKIDYVGLDATKQDDFDLHHANLVSAIHSQEGSIKTELLESDGIYAELIPDQQIELAFTLPENSKDARTYIIYAKGHYYTIS